MTTPDRIRRRQRREAWFIAGLAFALVLGWFYFRDRTEQTVSCIVSYAETQADTSLIRSGLVERESQATRDVIRGARRATTRREFEDVIDAYERRLHRIDRARERNPLPGFDVEECTR